MDFYAFLLPVLVCVILPVAVVFIIGRVRQNETNRKTEVLLKSLESGATIDPGLLATPKKPKTLKEKMLKHLEGACSMGFLGIVFLVGGIFLCNATHWALPEVLLPIVGGILIANGISQLIVYLTGKKMMAKEIEAEEKRMTEQE